MACKLILLALLATLSHFADAHGMMTKPAARSSCPSCNNYCPHCMNAGGPGQVRANTPGGRWPAVDTEVTAVRRGLCGDPAGGPQPYLTAGPVAATYQMGQVIDVEMRITAHHQGHIELRLCDNANSLTQTCLNTHHLRRVDTDESPIDPLHPDRWYLPPNTGGYSSQFNYHAQYQLPANLTCSNCVIQWWYVTANSCLPPDYKRFDFPSSAWWSSGLPACGATYGEEFWNCADIAIIDGAPGSTSSSITTSSTTSSTTSTTTAGHQCSSCTAGTSGTCISPSGACADFIPGTDRCYDGTVACTASTSTTTTVSASGDQCTDCFGTSSGPCQAENKACYEYIPMTTMCWPGSKPCKTAISSTSSTTTSTASTTTRPTSLSTTASTTTTITATTTIPKTTTTTTTTITTTAIITTATTISATTAATMTTAPTTKTTTTAVVTTSTTITTTAITSTTATTPTTTENSTKTPLLSTSTSSKSSTSNGGGTQYSTSTTMMKSASKSDYDSPSSTASTAYTSLGGDPTSRPYSADVELTPTPGVDLDAFVTQLTSVARVRITNVTEADINDKSFVSAVVQALNNAAPEAILKPSGVRIISKQRGSAIVVFKLKVAPVHAEQLFCAFEGTNIYSAVLEELRKTDEAFAASTITGSIEFCLSCRSNACSQPDIINLPGGEASSSDNKDKSFMSTTAGIALPSALVILLILALVAVVIRRSTRREKLEQLHQPPLKTAFANPMFTVEERQDTDEFSVQNPSYEELDEPGYSELAGVYDNPTSGIYDDMEGTYESLHRVQHNSAYESLQHDVKHNGAYQAVEPSTGYERIPESGNDGGYQQPFQAATAGSTVDPTYMSVVGKDDQADGDYDNMEQHDDGYEHTMIEGCSSDYDWSAVDSSGYSRADRQDNYVGYARPSMAQAVDEAGYSRCRPSSITEGQYDQPSMLVKAVRDESDATYDYGRANDVNNDVDYQPAYDHGRSVEDEDIYDQPNASPAENDAALYDQGRAIEDEEIYDQPNSASSIYDQGRVDEHVYAVPRRPQRKPSVRVQGIPTHHNSNA
eukprot:TRINITY_DN11804_c3_g7_i1.p1 TRINITY_DN11804_c3_g7~~TRINITY_DN11804_c3_g7_i1.p1  ORF type:complete len:1086 (+),score=147.66 TRINITY_DN11804_c3_g7_i1:103-3258(+)